MNAFGVFGVKIDRSVSSAGEAFEAHMENGFVEWKVCQGSVNRPTTRGDAVPGL